jgi:hypothetical protein
MHHIHQFRNGKALRVGERTICTRDAAMQKEEEAYEPVSVHASEKDIKAGERCAKRPLTTAATGLGYLVAIVMVTSGPFL